MLTGIIAGIYACLVSLSRKLVLEYTERLEKKRAEQKSQMTHRTKEPDDTPNRRAIGQIGSPTIATRVKVRNPILVRVTRGLNLVIPTRDGNVNLMLILC